MRPGDLVNIRGPKGNGDRVIAIGIIVRNGNVGKNLQSWYDQPSGTRMRRYGPKQVPHDLV